jgi:hypothetical protein
MGRREDASEAALLWDALERFESLDAAAKVSKPRHACQIRAVKLVVGDFEPRNFDGEHSATIVVTLTTGRRIIAMAKRIIRERMVELGQLDPSEAAPPDLMSQSATSRFAKIERKCRSVTHSDAKAWVTERRRGHPMAKGTAVPQPWEIVREFIREIEKPDAGLQTHTKQTADVWSSHNWGDIGKRAIAAALRDALSRSVPEIAV